MDYFQGVVTEYLRAKRSQFVNTEYMINLDSDGKYLKDRHWYCDVVTVDFETATVRLCEITYSKSLQAIGSRLQAWCSNWPAVVAAVHRDSSLGENWSVVPQVFVPKNLENDLLKKVKSLSRVDSNSQPMPEPVVTTLEEVLPWKYGAKGTEEVKSP